MMMEDMLHQVQEQVEIIHVLQEEMPKVRAGKEAIDGGGGIYVDLGVKRSKSVTAGNSREDGDQQRKWGRFYDDDARKSSIKSVFKKAKLNKFNEEKKT